MGKGNTSVKKVFTVIGNVIIWLFLIFAIIITVLAFAAKSSDPEAPAIGGKIIWSVQSDSMEPTFYKGDLIIGQKVTEEDARNLQVGDIIGFRVDLDGDNVEEFNTHKIIAVTRAGNSNNVVSYKTQGDNNEFKDSYDVLPSMVISKYTGTRIKKLGSVLSFLQVKQNFLFVIVLPLIAFFIYELIIFLRKFFEMKYGAKAPLSADEAELIRQQAIEEYRRSQAGNVAEESAAEAPAEKTEEAPAEEAVTEEVTEEEATAEEAEAPAEEATEEAAAEEETEEAPAEEAAAEEEAPADEAPEGE